MYIINKKQLNILSCYISIKLVLSIERYSLTAVPVWFSFSVKLLTDSRMGLSGFIFINKSGHGFRLHFALLFPFYYRAVNLKTLFYLFSCGKGPAGSALALVLYAGNGTLQHIKY